MDDYLARVIAHRDLLVAYLDRDDAPYFFGCAQDKTCACLNCFLEDWKRDTPKPESDQ